MLNYVILCAHFELHWVAMRRFFFTFFLVAMISFHATGKDYSAGWELWYPYQYHNKERQLVGLDIDAFKAIMNTAGITYSIAELPWKTHLHFVKTGKVDIAMGASWSKEREAYAYFTLPYRKETVKLFVKRGNAEKIKLNKLEDLAGSSYIIGVESGYYYGEDYQTLIKNDEFRANVSEVIDLEENVTLLMKGHLDGFLVDPYTMQAFVEKYGMDNEFEAHSVEIYSADIFIMLSKQSTDPALLDKINRAIKTLTEDGSFDAIYSDWSRINKTK